MGADYACCRSPVLLEQYDSILHGICVGIILSCTTAALPFATLLILTNTTAYGNVRSLLIPSIAVAGLNTCWLLFLAILLRYKVSQPRFCMVTSTRNRRGKDLRIGPPTLLHSTNQRLAPTGNTQPQAHNSSGAETITKPAIYEFERFRLLQHGRSNSERRDVHTQAHPLAGTVSRQEASPAFNHSMADLADRSRSVSMADTEESEVSVVQVASMVEIKPIRAGSVRNIEIRRSVPSTPIALLPNPTT